MKERIDKVFSDLKNECITEKQAHKLVLDLLDVSDSAEHDYSKDKYEVRWLINDTYQVERNGTAELQGDKKSCEDYARLCTEHYS